MEKKGRGCRKKPQVLSFVAKFNTQNMISQSQLIFLFSWLKKKFLMLDFLNCYDKTHIMRKEEK